MVIQEKDGLNIVSFKDDDIVVVRVHKEPIVGMEYQIVVDIVLPHSLVSMGIRGEDPPAWIVDFASEVHVKKVIPRSVEVDWVEVRSIRQIIQALDLIGL